jgi:hypothetical protein
MLEKFIAKWGDKMFEAEMAKIVNRHALCASIVMLIILPHRYRPYHCHGTAVLRGFTLSYHIKGTTTVKVA